MPVTREQARAAKDAVKQLLVQVPGSSVGLTKRGEDYAVKVNLREALPPGVSLPDAWGAVPLCVEVIGPVVKRG